jgi:hypothetical protein
MTDSIAKIITRDLEKLKQELLLYKNEENIWTVEKGITNSTGNLALHLVGNLKTFIGLQLGNHVYVRNREAEFSSKNISLLDLVKSIDETMTVVNDTLESIKNSDLTVDHAYLIWDKPHTIEYMLIHLCGHLNYHLGQVNYHRRLLDR